MPAGRSGLPLRGLSPLGTTTLPAVNQVSFKFPCGAFREEPGLHAMKVTHTLITVDSGIMRQHA